MTIYGSSAAGSSSPPPGGSGSGGAEESPGRQPVSPWQSSERNGNERPTYWPDQTGHAVERGGAAVPDAAAVPPGPRGWRDHRATLLITAVVVLIAGAGAFGMVAMLSGGGSTAALRPPAQVPVADASSSAPAAGAADESISLSATGDIIMGNAPGALPPNNARDFFKPVLPALRADLQMGNLEQPLTNETGVGKCSPETAGKTCFAFRSPPGYAGVLRDAGFKVLNLANNHAYDFGADGNRQTRAALESAGLQHTGAPGQITVAEVKGVRVAVLGFSSYAWSQSVVDIAAAATLVKKAAEQSDLVVVQMHVGAEGADKTHVKPGTEMFLGENRGDPIRFARAVVDAGADLVIGHGPHVMRAMEFHQGRLIAYSLGNFAGYRSLNYNGVVGVGGVLKVTLRKDGTWVGGTLVPTHMVAPGTPAPDPAKQALSLVRSLSNGDLPASGARIGADGSISPR